MDIDHRYKSLLNLVKKKREEFNRFVTFLEKETSWLTSPASTRFHNDFEGGLLKHSISVAETLLKNQGDTGPQHRK